MKGCIINSTTRADETIPQGVNADGHTPEPDERRVLSTPSHTCLLYTSDAADE